MTAPLENGRRLISGYAVKQHTIQDHPTNTENTNKRRSSGIQDLPDRALLTIFKHIPTERNKEENRHALPLVCRRWHHLLESQDAASLWTAVEATLPIRANLRTYSYSSLYKWMLKHSASIKSLTLEINSVESWKTVHALIGLLGRNLTALKIFSDNDESPCHEVRGNAPWLTLVPHLKSLELEGVVDTSIEGAELPSGLTQLSLNGCGLNGLYKVPSSLAKLPNLQRLSLQFLDAGADLENLTQLITLRHVDLSNCGLRYVPEELISLTYLTSLTLNNNEELGGVGNHEHIAVLEKLTQLQQLEMRDCALKSIPNTITGLRSIKTLLLGYNDFTGSTAIVPMGPYLSSLEFLAISDCIPEPVSAAETLVRPLATATALHTLRLNRNWGLVLTTAVVANLLRGKPRFRKLEYSEDMAMDLDLGLLKRKFPRVVFKIID